MLAVNILLCVLMAVVHLAVAFFVFAVMIVGMNGFDGKSSEWGIGLYILMQIFFVILTMVISFFSFRYLQTSRQINAAVSFFLVAAVSFVGILIFNAVSFFAGMIATSIAWNNR